MPLESDIDGFCVWAAKLGCPPESIPSTEALKSIFKSRQRDLFCDLIKRVQPRQDVQQVHENLLIRQMKKLQGQVVPACSRAYLPKEMQVYLKMQELQKRKSEIEARLKEYRQDQEALAAKIKTKNIQHISLKRKQETLQVKVNLLEFKSAALQKQLVEEENNKSQIIETMPVRLTAKNASETLAMESLKQALQELDQFYNLCDDQSNSPHTIKDAKDKLWCKMHLIFANIPNFMLLNGIMRMKDEQLHHIIILNKTNSEETVSHSVNSVTAKEPLSAFDMKLQQTKADLLGLVVKYMCVRKERAMLEERFSDAYGPFIDELQKKMNLFNVDIDENSDDIISDYVVQYNLRNFSRSQNDFISCQIDQLKADIEKDAKLLENHEVVLGSIKQVYNDISTSVHRIQYEMMQLGQIKDKILFSKNMLKQMLDDVQPATLNSTIASGIGAIKSNFKPTKLKVNSNTSAIGGESFEMGGGDTVFCSTKLDFDSTIMSLNSTTLSVTTRRSMGGADTTLMPVAGGNNEGRLDLPSYSTELSIFAEIPFEKFNCVTAECAFHLSPNPLIVESRELSSTIQLAPGSLLTAAGALQEVRNSIMWADLIAKHSHELKLDLDLIMVDQQGCKQKIKQQREQIEELLDKIDLASSNTNRTLKKLSKLYDFMLQNPLRHYIPAERVYNNQTYADYEAEFTMYYRIYTAGAASKS